MHKKHQILQWKQLAITPQLIKDWKLSESTQNYHTKDSLTIELFCLWPLVRFLPSRVLERKATCHGNSYFHFPGTNFKFLTKNCISQHTIVHLLVAFDYLELLAFGRRTKKNAVGGPMKLFFLSAIGGSLILYNSLEINCIHLYGW